MCYKVSTLIVPTGLTRVTISFVNQSAPLTIFWIKSSSQTLFFGYVLIPIWMIAACSFSHKLTYCRVFLAKHWMLLSNPIEAWIFFPIISLARLPVSSLRKQPQDLLKPFLKLLPLIIFSIPQSHIHNHRTWPYLFLPTSFSTVNLPNFLPTMSILIPIS